MFNILVNDETESVKTIHSSALSWLQTVRIKGCFVGTLNIFIKNNKFALILKITRSCPYCPKQRQHKSSQLTIGQNIKFNHRWSFSILTAITQILGYKRESAIMKLTLTVTIYFCIQFVATWVASSLIILYPM